MTEPQDQPATVAVRRREPVALAWLLLPAALGTVLAAVWPGLHPWLARDGLATLHGQLWRLVTPVLVQPGPVALVVGLFVLVALVAWPAERWFGSARMATLYLVGTVAGDIAGIWWDPQGAGIAIAGCGVLGGFAVWWLRMRRSGPVSAGLWVIVIGVFLAVGHAIYGVALLAGAVAGFVVLRDVPAVYRGRVRG